MTPPLHRDEMRFHTTVGKYSCFGKLDSCVSKIFYLILINRLCNYNFFLWFTQIAAMADIASRSRFSTVGALCYIHHIARSVLH